MGLALDKRKFKGKKEKRLGKINLEMDRRWPMEGSYPGTPKFLRKRRQGMKRGARAGNLGGVERARAAALGSRPGKRGGWRGSCEASGRRDAWHTALLHVRSPPCRQKQRSGGLLRLTSTKVYFLHYTSIVGGRSSPCRHCSLGRRAEERPVWQAKSSGKHRLTESAGGDPRHCSHFTDESKA